MKYKKIPKQILILDYISEISDNIREQIHNIVPNTVVNYTEEDRQYDLVFLSNYIFKFDNLMYYRTISTSEIIFKREGMTLEIFREGLRHYSECNSKKRINCNLKGRLISYNYSPRKVFYQRSRALQLRSLDFKFTVHTA
ncbi:hypothetical protein P3W45_000819 [Vairimorpha bombi]